MEWFILVRNHVCALKHKQDGERLLRSYIWSIGTSSGALLHIRDQGVTVHVARTQHKKRPPHTNTHTHTHTHTQTHTNTQHAGCTCLLARGSMWVQLSSHQRLCLSSSFVFREHSAVFLTFNSCNFDIKLAVSFCLFAWCKKHLLLLAESWSMLVFNFKLTLISPFLPVKVKKKWNRDGWF